MLYYFVWDKPFSDKQMVSLPPNQLLSSTNFCLCAVRTVKVYEVGVRERD